MFNNTSRLITQVTLALALVSASGCGSDSQMPAHHETWQLDQLTAEEGVSLELPTFSVPAGHEEQSCYFMQFPDLNDGQDVFIKKFRMRMNTGSHHMNVFRVKTIIDLKPENGEPTMIGPYAATVVHGHDDYMKSPCWQSANWADWPLVANTEVAEPPDWDLPEGVGARFSPGEMIMIQPHYVNTSTQPTPSGQARIAINMYRSHDPNLQELGTLFATQQSIRICKSNPEPVYSGTCRFPSGITITAANGHFHSRGKEFDMFTWNGTDTTHPPSQERFYTSSSWSDPPMATNLERQVSEGGGIWWDCAYRWTAPTVFSCNDVNTKDKDQQGDCCYTFGGNTDVGEHCNVFLYYYPKLEGTTDVFCN